MKRRTYILIIQEKEGIYVQETSNLSCGCKLCFLSWEAVYRLWHLDGKTDLRQIPSAVGGDTALRRGIVIAKSIPAKKYGIQTGEPLIQARGKCPELLVVPPDYELYERCSAAFFQVLEEYTPLVEKYSIDEAFLDMSGWERHWKSPVEAAEHLKKQVSEKLGFTVNVGISENKLLAKMASDFRKPDQAHTLFPEEIPEKMWPLPVSDLFFVGLAAERKLRGMGIRQWNRQQQSHFQSPGKSGIRKFHDHSF